MLDYRRSVYCSDGRGGSHRRRAGNVLATKETNETMNFRRNIRQGIDPGGRAENAASGIKGSGCPDNRCRIRNYMKILTIQQEHP